MPSCSYRQLQSTFRTRDRFLEDYVLGWDSKSLDPVYFVLKPAGTGDPTDGINNLSYSGGLYLPYAISEIRYWFILITDWDWENTDTLQCVPASQCWEVIDTSRTFLPACLCAAGRNTAFQRLSDEHCVSEITMCWYWPAVLHGSFLWWTRLCTDGAVRPRRLRLCVSRVAWGRAVIEGGATCVCMSHGPICATMVTWAESLIPDCHLVPPVSRALS